MVGIMKSVVCLFGVAIITAGVWLFFYSFHLWPWPVGPTLEWWCIPHLLSALGLLSAVVMIGGLVIEYGRRM